MKKITIGSLLMFVSVSVCWSEEVVREVSLDDVRQWEGRTTSRVQTVDVPGVGVVLQVALFPVNFYFP